MDVVVQGLLLGGLYATAALGLSLVFGTMRLVNLAHGQFLVFGAYLTSILVSIIGGDPLLLAIPVALVVGLLAYPIQRYIFTPVMAQGDEAAGIDDGVQGGGAGNRAERCRCAVHVSLIVAGACGSPVVGE
jgi:branched-chain amino acid transport system permease protein